MRHTYLLFLASRPSADEVRRCCTDVPARTLARSRPTAMIRWPRKLRAATPLSLRVFLRSMARPIRETDRVPAVGTRVVTSAGTPVGHVREVLVGLSDGAPALAIEPQDASPEGDTVVFLLPRDSVTPSDDGTVVLRRGLGGDLVA